MEFECKLYNELQQAIHYSKLSKSLNFSGDLKLTDKWKIGFNSGYDFDANDLSYTSLNIYRDLHCWEMLVKWIPFGYRQSYNFTIRVKASVLQDLKWERRKIGMTISKLSNFLITSVLEVLKLTLDGIVLT